MRYEERWDEIEERLGTVVLDVGHRSYTPESKTGVRHLVVLIRRNLVAIEELLLEEIDEKD